MPKVQTTSMKNAENRGVVGEVVCVLGAVVSVVVAMLAAGPVYWQHEPFNAQLNPIGGMVGSLPRPPPIGLTCASMGPRAQDAFTETEEGHTAHRPPDAPHASSDTTEAEPRRIPPLVAYGNRAVGAEKSPYQQHVESYTPHRGARTQIQRTPGNLCSSGL